MVTSDAIVSAPGGDLSTASDSVSGAALVLWCAVPAILFALLYERAAWSASGTLGFPLDDAWIHAQFARNIATGRGFSYTGGRWVAGSTSPGWTLLLAAGYFVTRSALISAKLLGLLLQIASGALAGRLVHLLTGRRDLAVGGALLVVVSPAMVWGGISGMELGLASTLVLAGFCCYLDTGRGERRAVAALALLAAACLARPEALVIVAIVAAHLLAGTRPFGRLVWRACQVGIVLAIVLGPFVAFDYATTGRPLPTTFYAKSGRGLMRALAEHDGAQMWILLRTMGPEAVRQFGATLVEQWGVAAIVALAGAAAAFTPDLRRRGAPLLVATVLVSAYGMGVIAPMRLKPENFRYTAQLLAVTAVVSVAGLAAWTRSSRRGAAVAMAVLLLLVTRQTVLSVPVYAASVRNIEQLQVALGRWMARWLPADARVAVNDIGAVAFFSRRDIIDLEGLATPESLAYPRPTRGIGVVTATRPDFIAIFPFWYPDISSRPGLFAEVHRISIEDNVVSAGDTIVVYRTPWTREPLLTVPQAEHRRRWPD